MSLSDADLDLMRRWASMSDPKRNGTMDWEAAIAELQDLRARVGGTDGPDQGDPAAWAHPDEEEEVSVRRALACAHSPEDAVSGWPTVAGVLAVEVERLRALVRAPGAVAAPSNQGDPAAWMWEDGLGDRHSTTDPEQAAALQAMAKVGPPRVIVPLYRASGAVAAAPPNGTPVSLQRECDAATSVAAAAPGDEEQDPDGPAKAVREVLTGGVRSDDLPWEQVTPAQVDHYRAVAAAARAVPPAPPAGREDVAVAPPNGCAWCEVEEREHASRFHETPGQHTWAAPTDAQRLARMRQRSAAPPAGHEDEAAVQLPALGQLGGTREDEAAVERAARTFNDTLYPDCPWEQIGEPGRSRCRAAARAALAAARGPRTPDPTEETP